MAPLRGIQRGGNAVKASPCYDVIMVNLPVALIGSIGKASVVIAEEGEPSWCIILMNALWPLTGIYGIAASARSKLHRNSLRLGDVYMRQWTGSSWIQVVINQCWLVINWTSGTNFCENSKQNTVIFSQEIAFENVFYMIATIMSWP